MKESKDKTEEALEGIIGSSESSQLEKIVLKVEGKPEAVMDVRNETIDCKEIVNAAEDWFSHYFFRNPGEIFAQIVFDIEIFFKAFDFQLKFQVKQSLF